MGMMDFVFNNPTKLLFGTGKLGELHNEDLPGKKALLLLSRGQSAHKNGSYDKTVSELEKAGVEHVEFAKIMENPLMEVVEEGGAFAREQGCDFIVALGGGAVLDSSVAVATMATNPGRIWDYVVGGTGKGLPIQNKPLPIVTIATSSGTGSEVNEWGVICNEETHEKIGFGDSKLLKPVLAVVDPTYMRTVPSNYTAYQGFDAFFHNEEESIEAEELIKKCIDKISSIKADKYAQACNLAEEGTEKSISTAISLLREISPFDDSKNRIMVYQKKLEDEKAYNKAVSMMSGTDISNLIAVKETFEDLGSYKDSVIKAAACEKYLKDLCEKKYQEAKDTQAVYTVDSQTLAMAAYSELGDYKDALERIAICTSNITVIQEMLDLEEQLERHKEELKSLTGFFKRRQRQEKEELINKVEQQIAGLKDRLEEVN